MSYIVVNGFVTDTRSMDEFMRDLDREAMSKAIDASTKAPRRKKPSTIESKGKRPQRPIGRRHN